MHPSQTIPQSPDDQRDALLESERQANRQQPRNFKDDALKDKVVEIEPDGTGPSDTGSLDPKVDRDAGSGNDAGGGEPATKPDRG